MATKYLSTTGNNTHTGDADAPWKTLEFALKEMDAGDELMIEEGVYPSRLEIDDEGAYRSHYYLSHLENLRIRSRSGAKVVIDGSIPQMSQFNAWAETMDPSLDFDPLVRRPNVYVSTSPIKIKNFAVNTSGFGISIKYEDEWYQLTNYKHCPESLKDYLWFRKFQIDIFLAASKTDTIEEFVDVLITDADKPKAHPQYNDKDFYFKAFLNEKGIPFRQFLEEGGNLTEESWAPIRNKIVNMANHYRRLQFLRDSFISDNIYPVKSTYDVEVSDKNKHQPYYLGPGFFYDVYTHRVYLRLNPSPPEAVGNFTHTDREIELPRNVFSELSLSDLRTSDNPETLNLSMGVYATGSAAYFAGYNWQNISFHGIEFLNHHSGVFRFGEVDSRNVSFTNCIFRNRRMGLLIARAEAFKLENCLFDGQIPPWIAWGDVKNGYAVGSSNDAQMLRFARGIIGNLNDKSKHHQVSNCTFKRCMDGILIASDSGCGTGNEARAISIKNSHFDGVLDDSILIGSSSHHIEVGHNHFDHVGSAVAYTGDGCVSPPAAHIGKIFIHHNLVICAPIFGSRKLQADLGVEYYCIQPFITTHGNAGRSPRKIYNNTIRLKGTKDEVIIRENKPNIAKLMPGYQGIRELSSSYLSPAERHEVFNNIFIQEETDLRLGGGSTSLRVEDGYEVFDGNIYTRLRLPGTDEPLFRTILYDGVNTEGKPKFKGNDYNSLNDFTTVSPEDFRRTQTYYVPGWENSGYEGEAGLNSSYRPEPGSVASQPGVDLRSLNYLDGYENDSPYRGAFPPMNGGCIPRITNPLMMIFGKFK